VALWRGEFGRGMVASSSNIPGLSMSFRGWSFEILYMSNNKTTLTTAWYFSL
jgi:hypothetical protein